MSHRSTRIKIYLPGEKFKDDPDHDHNYFDADDDDDEDEDDVDSKGKQVQGILYKYKQEKEEIVKTTNEVKWDFKQPEQSFISLFLFWIL